MCLRKSICLAVFFTGLLMLMGTPWATSPERAHMDAEGHVFTLRIDGGIGPASLEFITTGLERAARDNARLVVLEMDTPGGLDTSMRLIIKHILASPVPVATYVSPDGARAASAGTFILYASHIAAMAPATNLGAASPVAMGGMPGGGSPQQPEREDDAQPEEENGAAAPPSTGDTMTDKVVNDAVAYIRGLAELRERDADFAERAVREAASMPASEALEAGVIEFVAPSLQDLLTQLEGHEVTLGTGEQVTLALGNATVETVEPDWRHQILALLSNPQIALVLMMIGIYGLFFEFTSPGFGVPGVAGAISLLIAFYGLQLLPVNGVGVALLVLGVLLMMAEAFLPSFGALGVGGVAAFVIGGLFLIDSDLPGFGLPLSFLVITASLSAVMLFAIGTFAVRARRRRVVSGYEHMIGASGTITRCTANTWHALVQGEVWQVRSTQALAPGQEIRVVGVDGLTLEVEPAPPTPITLSTTQGGT